MNRKKIRRLIMIIFFAICIGIGGIILNYVKNHYASIRFVAAGQQEITDDLSYPECGWYQLYTYPLSSDTTLVESEIYLEQQDSNNRPYQLALLEFNLANYQYQPLDTMAKKNLRTILNRFSKTNMKLILRFLYDWDGNGKETEPNDISMIKNHMRQIGRIINEYQKHIYTTQGIFVGSWGEMHTSNYLSDKDMTELLVCFANATDDSIYLAVRTPKQYQTICSEIEKNPKKYSITIDALKKRLGLYNDGIMGSYSDLGTYASVDAAKTKTEKLEQRAKELQFQNTLCQSVPNGGEVVSLNDYNQSEHAITSLRTMHISYLNQTYDKEVLDGWKKTSYTGTDYLFSQDTLYDYITKHLGARYVLRDCAVSYTEYQDDAIHCSIHIENVGFSNLYFKRKLSLFMVPDTTSHPPESEESAMDKTSASQQDIIYELPLPSSDTVSCTKWNAGELTTINCSFSPFDYPAGTYVMYISLTDSKRENTLIPFANSSYDHKQKAYRLGTLTIKHY